MNGRLASLDRAVEAVLRKVNAPATELGYFPLLPMLVWTSWTSG
jgi:hypothetical protein